MNTLNIALLQLLPHGDDRDANLAKGEEYCRRARAMGADIALFPELWSIGFTFHVPQPASAPGDVRGEYLSDDLWRAPELWAPGRRAPDHHLRDAIAAWHALAIPRDSAFVRHFQALARELEMAIAITYLEAWPSAPRNTVSLIDRHGAIILTYAKVHLCDFAALECSLTPGDGFYVADLDTAGGSVKVGAMICYDREFPESARVLMLKGAEIILTPNASTLEPLHISQFKLRAYENSVGVAMANYAAPQNTGHSAAFHPVAVDAQGSRDTLVVEAGAHEEIYLARFDVDELRAHRRRETWGNAFRRPQLYGALVSAEVEEPFVRVNAAGERWDHTRRSP
jgi:predicted amidohydrolase